MTKPLLVAACSLATAAYASTEYMMTAAGRQGLCGNDPVIIGGSAKRVCGETAMLAGQSWGPCCIFNASSTGAVCRSWETSESYCANETCDTLTNRDTVSINVVFDGGEEDVQCCKSCTCYGDPECVSFDGSQDVWIPCDARGDNKNTCMVKKSICNKKVGHNGKSCKWIRKGKSNSKGWDMAMFGSPCVPDDDDGADPALMTMYETNRLSVNLALGERGIIQEFRMTIGENFYNLDADACFEDEGDAAWDSSAPIPEEWTHKHTKRAVTWRVFDQKSNVLAVLLCTRSIKKGVYGPPRINVQELTVDNGDRSTGFCASGSIDDKTGDTEGSQAIHKMCHQDRATALQACKFLVSFGSTMNEIELCASVYCSVAAVDSEKECVKKLGDGQDADPWVDVYCDALMNLGIMSAGEKKSCVAQINEQGWDYATNLWDKGYKPALATDDVCGSSIDEYTLDKKGTCDQGVYVDIEIDGEWVPSYFIPSHFPPCGGNILTTAEVAPELFHNRVAIRQCDPVRSSDVCSELSSCSSTVGVTTSVIYANTGDQISELYRNGMLQCVPKEGSDSTTWCFPEDDDYVPSDLCVCEN